MLPQISACRTWEHFSHGADIGIRGIGPTREAAFQQVALALTSVITELKVVGPEGTVRITCEEPTDDLLLRSSGAAVPGDEPLEDVERSTLSREFASGVRTEVETMALTPSRFGLGSTAWVIIVAVLLVVLAAMVTYFR